MRRGRETCFIGDDNSFIGDDNSFLGINLGSDFCSEHEHGLNDLRGLFGIQEPTMNASMLRPALVGIQRRQIRCVPVELCYRVGSHGEPDILACVQEHSQAAFHAGKPWYGAQELSGPGVDGLVATWSNRAFGLAANTPYAKTCLAELKAAFDKLDVAFWIGQPPMSTLSRGGLQLAIVSRIPKNLLDTLREADEAAAKLLFAAQDTGIWERLQKAGKDFFALSPSWARTHPSIKTKNPVVFWLNPRDQRDNNAGWFSVEQLDQWTRNRGPIPKNKKQKARA